MSYRLRRALREGALWMLQDENFAQHHFDVWYVECMGKVKPAQLVALFDPEDPNWRKQWLIIGTLAYEDDEQYWPLFRLAYEEGSQFIREMGLWAMERINPKRAGFEIGIADFFMALSRFAEQEFIDSGGQLSLF